MRSRLVASPVALGVLLLLQVTTASALNYGPCVNWIPLGKGYCDESSFWDPKNWDPGQTPGPTTIEILSGPGAPATLYLGSSSSGYPASPTTQAIDVQEGDYTLDGRSFSNLNDPALRSVLNLTAPGSSSAIHVGSDFGLADARLTLLETEIVVPANA
jgi:hypothetical protein